MGDQQQHLQNPNQYVIHKYYIYIGRMEGVWASSSPIVIDNPIQKETPAIKMVKKDSIIFPMYKNATEADSHGLIIRRRGKAPKINQTEHYYVEVFVSTS